MNFPFIVQNPKVKYKIGRRGAAKDFHHKEHIEHKEMEGGNEANVVSGITQFAEGEPKRWKYDSILILYAVDNQTCQYSTTTASAVEYF